MTDALRLLAVFPHPDDETLGMGSGIAWTAASGVQVDLICATRGERGWTGPPEENPGLQALGRIREAELRAAARHLGIHAVHLLGYTDGELDLADPRKITVEIAAIIRALRPQVVVTYGPEGIYGHPDHMLLSQYTAAAILEAALPEVVLPGADTPAGYGAPHVVDKFYYSVDTTSVVEMLNREIGGIGMQINGEQRRHVAWPEWAVTARLDASSVYEAFWQALLSHQSQIPGFGRLVDLPEATLREIFRYATFVRVFSRVNGGAGVEDDLFAGLR